MTSICNSDCSICCFNKVCAGCTATCGRPFGGRCVAADYIKAVGRDAYDEFKENLKAEINQLLESLSLPKAETLFELPGKIVNMEYTLPGGEKTKFLDDGNIYLGTQIELPDCGVCCGVAADAEFILICRYGENGSNPELVLYRKR